MKWFEKEYKKRFENESSLEGVDSGPLWEQISKSIPQNKPSRKAISWKWSLLALFLVGVTMGWFFAVDKTENEDMLLSQTNPTVQTTGNLSENKNVTSTDINSKNSNLDSQIINKEENTELNTTKQQSDLTEPNLYSKITVEDDSQNGSNDGSIKKIERVNKNNNTLKNDSNNSYDVNDTESINSKKTIKKYIESSDLNYPIKPITNAPIDEAKTKNNSSQKDNPIQIKGSIQSDNVNSNIAKTNQTPAINKEFESTESTRPEEVNTNRSRDVSNPVESKNLIELNKLDLIQIEGLIRNESINTPAVAPVKIKVKRRNPFAFQIQTNANFFDLKYKDDQNSELFAGTANASLGSLQLGNSIGLKVDYYLNRSWSINAGVEISNYENKLNTVLTSDITVLDTFNKLRNAKSIRTVSHHNKLSTLSIPVGIAYENHISDRWVIGASVGVSYAIVNAQSGRLRGRNNTILNYSNEENSQFTNFLSLRINPFLKYRIGDNVSLTLNGGFSMQSHGQAEIQELTQSSKIYSLGIGFQYKM